VPAVLVRAVLAVAFYVAIVATFGFILLPIIGVFAHVPIGQLLAQFSSPVVIDALEISVKAVLISQVAILLVGTPAAYFLASRRFRGRTLAVTVVELPIVLPPAVAGIGLFYAFGRYGLLGGTFSALGINVSFNLAAVVLAVTLVSGPFYVRQGIASFEAIDTNLVAASRTLGAGRARTFFRVTLPLAASGLAAGEALSLARGLGEFGATIMFAGSLQGRTETLPLAVYEQFVSGTPTGIDQALAISALLVVLSLAILLSLKIGVPWKPSAQSSPSPFARFSSR
jgi:molybdate transport system permease protein